VVLQDPRESVLPYRLVRLRDAESGAVRVVDTRMLKPGGSSAKKAGV